MLARLARPPRSLRQNLPAKTTATATASKRSYSATVAKARRARVAQARATAKARDIREVQTPRFTVDEAGQEVPDVRAAAAIIYNPETQQVLWQSNAQEERSIASITKVMTALVFLRVGHAARHAGHRAAHRRLPRVDHVSARRLPG